MSPHLRQYTEPLWCLASVVRMVASCGPASASATEAGLWQMYTHRELVPTAHRSPGKQ